MTYKVIVVKLPQEATLDIWQTVGEYSFQYRHTLTASHDDVIGLLQNGTSDSYAKIVNPNEPSQQATIRALNQLGLNWVPLELNPTFSFTHWPTDYKHINQRFGMNPQIYNSYGLPGHEGVDVRAYDRTPIYTVADGVVVDLHETPTGHNYGIFVRINHIDNWQTTYAHLAEVGVTLGQTVKGGHTIGLADSTGNSTGSHLHLTLKNLEQSYTDPTGTTWPYNIHNPEPFMQHFTGVYWPPLPPTDAPLPAFGLHLRADPDRPLSGEWAEVETLSTKSNPKIIKLLHAHPDSAFVDAATKLGSNGLYIIRIFQDGWLDRTISPTDFVNWNLAELNSKIGILNSYGIPYNRILVEIHNEPNLVQEGWNSYNWQSGTAFGNWLGEVITKLDLRLPGGVQLMYPGLSPGGGVNDVRYDATAFFNESKSTLTRLDALGVHSYWEAARGNMVQAINWVKWCQSNTNKSVYVTEASIVDRPSVIGVTERGKQYAQFVQGLADTAKGITFFVGSASNPYFEPEVWVNEDNTVKGIANALVGVLS